MSEFGGQVLVVTSGKGGVGKTTSSANIGAALSMLGKKVLLLDTDLGLRNLDIILGIENRIVFDIVDVVCGICDIEQALIEDKRFDGLFLMPASQTSDKDVLSEKQIKELILKLKERFDYIIIDCPAGIEQGFKNAVVAADKAIIVVTPDKTSIRDADRIIGLLEKNNLSDYVLLINRLRPDMIKKDYMLNIDEIIDILGIDLIGVVPEDEMIIVSANKNEPVVLNKKSKSGIAYKNVAERLTGNIVPLMEFEKKGIFRFFKKN